jgi:hypothetical protein
VNDVARVPLRMRGEGDLRAVGGVRRRESLRLTDVLLPVAVLPVQRGSAELSL